MHTSHVYLIFNVLLYVQRNIIFITFKRDGRKNATIQKKRTPHLSIIKVHHGGHCHTATILMWANSSLFSFSSSLFIIVRRQVSMHLSNSMLLWLRLQFCIIFLVLFIYVFKKMFKSLFFYSKPELHHYSKLVDQLISTALCYISPAVWFIILWNMNVPTHVVYTIISFNESF